MLWISCLIWEFIHTGIKIFWKFSQIITWFLFYFAKVFVWIWERWWTWTSLWKANWNDRTNLFMVDLCKWHAKYSIQQWITEQQFTSSCFVSHLLWHQMVSSWDSLHGQQPEKVQWKFQKISRKLLGDFAAAWRKLVWWSLVSGRPQISRSKSLQFPTLAPRLTNFSL